MMLTLAPVNIATAFQAALRNNLIRNEDTTAIFHDLSLLTRRINHLKSLFPEGTNHAVAIKANPLVKVLDYMQPLGTGVEAATVGEVYLALKTGYDPGKIVYDSPTKTMDELRFAMMANIHINIDNLEELERVAKLRQVVDSHSTFGIRINPQVGTGTIAQSSVAGEYSKFGVPIKTKRKEVMDAFRKHDWLEGLHLHVGSQGCGINLLVDGVKVLYDLMMELNRESVSNRVTIFDIGGGVPVSYTSSPPAFSMEDYVTALHAHCPALFAPHSPYTRPPRLITEFGRWIHVNTGWVACRVEYVKHDPPVNTIMIHAGADLFLRECLLPQHWNHEYLLVNRSGKLKSNHPGSSIQHPVSVHLQPPGNTLQIKPYNLAGPLCFSGDILATHVQLPAVKPGDYLIVRDTGGYTFSMWSRYNSRQTPRVIGYTAEGDHFEILKERESLEDIYNFWR